ncbi:hypothetical protein AGMMS50276_27680 [Synergistales bacterium]|nr:hypothetical protein AGMMS50276_27680 [Synergistales bacterium]
MPSYVLMTVFKKELSTGPGFVFSAQDLGEGLTGRMTNLGLRDMLKSEVKTMNGHQAFTWKHYPPAKSLSRRK